MRRFALHGFILAALAISLVSPPAAGEVTSPILRYTSYAVFALNDADIAAASPHGYVATAIAFSPSMKF